MEIFLATDHAGFAHKQAVVHALTDDGHLLTDCGAYTYDPDDDYPDFVVPAMQQLRAASSAARAIIFGGSGQGEAMLANTFPGIRAAVYYGSAPTILTLSRAHNDANVLSLGARFMSESDAVTAARTWLREPFSNDARHVRRLQKFPEYREAT